MKLEAGTGWALPRPTALVTATLHATLHLCRTMGPTTTIQPVRPRLLRHHRPRPERCHHLCCPPAPDRSAKWTAGRSG